MDNVCNSDFQRELISAIENNEDLQKYFLASGEIEQHLQEEADLQVGDGRLNDTRVRNRLYPLYKNVLREQNRLHLKIFQDLIDRIQQWVVC